MAAEVPRIWSHIPVDEENVYNADPTARVFDGKLYIYTSWDDPQSCGVNKKKGEAKFCMPGYRLYSCDDADLKENWKAHGVILREEDIPWCYMGETGYARMWAPDCIQGDDGLFYLFFPAPYQDYFGNINFRIGVATAPKPTGPFVARDKPIANVHGIDPSVIKLTNGRWALFSSAKSNKTKTGEIFVQYLNSDFSSATTRTEISGLKEGYKEGPFAEYRAGKLYLFYALSTPGKYSIVQAGANHAEKPEQGFWDVGTAIAPFDGRTNHGSVVSYKERSWAFYHRHTEPSGARWSARRVVYSPIEFNSWGKMTKIEPKFN